MEGVAHAIGAQLEDGLVAIEVEAETMPIRLSALPVGLVEQAEERPVSLCIDRRCGCGAGASRLMCGSLAPHHDLAEALAAFKGTEAALSFTSGYATALGAIAALLGKDDVIIVDKLVHACIVDAAKLSGAKLRVFRHNDLNDLESILGWAAQRRSGASPVSQVLVATESIFSMDGDQAPLREMVELKERYGAWLMVDEAHATGLLGPNRRGLAEAVGVGERIEIQMGTLGKALGAAGGYICGSRRLIDYLIHRARSFVFSTAPVPAAAGAATAGIRFVQSEAGRERCRQLWERAGEVRRGLRSLVATNRLETLAGPSGSPTRVPPFTSAIIPLMIGSEEAAVRASTEVLEAGVFIPAVRYPTVARGTARLRLTVSARHRSEDIRALHTALAGVLSNHELK